MSDIVGAIVAVALEHHRAGRFDVAEAGYRQALQQDPAAASAWQLSGVVAFQREALDRAATLIRRALHLADGVADWHSNLGNVLLQGRALDAAVGCYHRALRIDPAHAAAWSNAGAVALDQDRNALAVRLLRRAAAIRRDLPEVWGNLGNALAHTGRAPAAIRCQCAVLAMTPGAGAVYNNLGNALTQDGRTGDAVIAYRRALSLAPDVEMVHSNLIFALNFLPGQTLATHQEERRRWAARYAIRAATAWPGIIPDAKRRLRVGYLSAHFRQQAAAFAFAPVILNADAAEIETVCYADNAFDDALTGRLRSSAAEWHVVRALSDGQLAMRIRQDRIDILVDLAGHMVGHRLGVMARKPAPVQVTGWGEPTGTGLATVDALLADRVLVPMADRPLVVERVETLPCYLGYLPPDDAPPPGPTPALASGRITFGSFNRRAKLSAELLAAWGILLRRLPTARLLLKDIMFDDPEQRAAVTAILSQSAGVAVAGQIAFQGRVDRAAHFAAWAGVDIALDSFPHGGGMTSLDGLWMGVPVVTRTGATIPSRGTAAILAALGLGGRVATDWDGYIDAAVALAADPAGLAAMRAAIRPRMAATVADGAAYAAAVERVYRRLWQRWCATQAGG